jgi:hypothetical protein
LALFGQNWPKRATFSRECPAKGRFFFLTLSGHGGMEGSELGGENGEWRVVSWGNCGGNMAGARQEKNIAPNSYEIISVFRFFVAESVDKPGGQCYASVCG